jgi:gluconolactonase
MAAAAPGGPDGLTVDTAGRVWCVGSGGIGVVAPSGEGIGMVQTPAVVRNVACGGPDFCPVYLTPGGSLAHLEVTTPGIGAGR